MQELKDDIVNRVIEMHDKLSWNRNPKEWAVLAAIVAVYNTSEDAATSVVGKNEEEDEASFSSSSISIGKSKRAFEIISIATGSKCCSPNIMKDRELCHVRDCHAEILAKRGLMKYLYSEIDDWIIQEHNKTTSAVATSKIKHKVATPEKRLLEFVCINEETNLPQFRLKQSIDLILYISDSPCGDASICQRIPAPNSASDITAAKVTAVSSLRETGAKSIEMDDGNENINMVGILRTKSGRSDIRDMDRSTCHCCSDKIARWQYLGVQGSLLSMFIPEVVTLEGIIIGDDALLGVLQDPVLDLKFLENNAEYRKMCEDSVILSVKRALIDRFQEKVNDELYLKSIQMQISNIKYPRSRLRSALTYEGKGSPSASGMASIAIPWLKSLKSNESFWIENLTSARGIKFGVVNKKREREENKGNKNDKQSEHKSNYDNTLCDGIDGESELSSRSFYQECIKLLKTVNAKVKHDHNDDPKQQQMDSEYRSLKRSNKMYWHKRNLLIFGTETSNNPPLKGWLCDE